MIETLEDIGYGATEGYGIIYIYRINYAKKRKTIYIPFFDEYGRKLQWSNHEVY